MEAEIVEERMAILLKSLGDGVANAVLEQVSPDRAATMQTALDRLETAPPPDDEVSDVLEEFNRFIEFAFANSSDLSLFGGNSEDKPDELAEFVSSGDPYEDLVALQDFQIAGALRYETGSTIAIVLGQLPSERVGEIIRQLPDTVREDAFLQLQAAVQLARPLLTKIIKTTVERASRLDQTAASDPDHVADEKTVSLLRSMDRKTRTEMLNVLEKAQPEVAERVKGMLFVFADILRLTDKSIQKLLAEVDSSELATTLKNADAEIIERITSNLSKRAKATLLEEVEYLDTVSSEEEAEAQKAICDVLAQLDQAGNLEMME